MTQLELSMMGSCCYVQYCDIEQENGHSDVIMALWEKISEEAKDMGRWLEEAEFSLYESGDAMSNETLSIAFKKAIITQTDKFSFDSNEEISNEHTSFFEDEVNEALLIMQDRRDINVEVDYEVLKRHITNALPQMLEIMKLRAVQKKKAEAKTTILGVQNEIDKLVMFRGTKRDIIAKLNEIKIRECGVNLEAFENQLEGNDLGFNVNLGEIEDTYLDYEIYMLPTMKEDYFIITEINSF